MWSIEYTTQLTASTTTTKNSSIDFISSRLSSPQKIRATTPTTASAVYQNITPTIRSLSKSLDTDIDLILSDIQSATKFGKIGQGSKKASNASLTSLISDDFDHFNEQLEANLKKFGSDLCTSLQGLVEALAASDDENKIKKILLISRFSNALVNRACPQLRVSFSNVSKQVVSQRKSELISRMTETSDVMQILNAAKKKSALSETKVCFLTKRRLKLRFSCCKYNFTKRIC